MRLYIKINRNYYIDVYLMWIRTVLKSKFAEVRCSFLHLLRTQHIQQQEITVGCSMVCHAYGKSGVTLKQQ